MAVVVLRSLQYPNREFLTSVTAGKSCRLVEKEANRKLALKKSFLRRKDLVTIEDYDVPWRWRH